ncbi:MAG: holin family protein [Candidatus Zixiibacteriota bacterium]|nr:MAG: holin family protein [candidate division Zixibacteria bacterium]
MGLLSKILGGGTESILKDIGGIIDKFKLSPEEKNKLELEFQQLLQKKDAEIEETIRAELGAKERIMVAELTQGDNYTKRARPSVIYAGLVFIFINYCLIPIIQSIAGASIKPFDLPIEFWAAWGGIVGTYTIGRSVEKRGVRNKFTEIVTGAKKPGLLDI